MWLVILFSTALGLPLGIRYTVWVLAPVSMVVVMVIAFMPYNYGGPEGHDPLLCIASVSGVQLGYLLGSIWAAVQGPEPLRLREGASLHQSVPKVPTSAVS